MHAYIYVAYSCRMLLFCHAYMQSANIKYMYMYYICRSVDRSIDRYI